MKLVVNSFLLIAVLLFSSCTNEKNETYDQVQFKQVFDCHTSKITYSIEKTLIRTDELLEVEVSVEMPQSSTVTLPMKLDVMNLFFVDIIVSNRALLPNGNVEQYVKFIYEPELPVNSKIEPFTIRISDKGREYETVIGESVLEVITLLDKNKLNQIKDSAQAMKTVEDYLIYLFCAVTSVLLVSFVIFSVFRSRKEAHRADLIALKELACLNTKNDSMADSVWRSFIIYLSAEFGEKFASLTAEEIGMQVMNSKYLSKRLSEELGEVLLSVEHGIYSNGNKISPLTMDDCKRLIVSVHDAMNEHYQKSGGDK